MYGGKNMIDAWCSMAEMLLASCFAAEENLGSVDIGESWDEDVDNCVALGRNLLPVVVGCYRLPA